MSTAGAVTNLGAELVVFVAAASLLLLALTRPELVGAAPAGRATLQVGAVLLVVAAAVQGAVPDTDPATVLLAAGRLTGVAFLAVGALGLRARSSRTALLLAAAFLAAGEIAYWVDAVTVGHVIRGAGGIALGVGAASSARRSIAVRIAAAATALLLLVVLALSAALSAVITGNIASEALERTQERAQIEAGIVAQQADAVVTQASQLAGILGPSEGLRSGRVTGNYEPLRASMAALQSAYPQADFIGFVDSQGRAQVGVDIDQTAIIELAGGEVVADALTGTHAASVDYLSGGLVALGAAPISIGGERGAPELVGVAVAGNRLDPAFLRSRLQNQRSTQFALLTGERVAATSGEGSPTELAAVVGESLADDVEPRVLGQGEPVSAETSIGGEGQFVAAHPVLASDGRPVAAFVVTQDSSLVGDTRASLFHAVPRGP
ncbi:MAG TPA: cache domain-containing protein, partial [Acidimicrobiia bacterium]|nr:cache domain-containing protein [Acidimicrobiia bacterium]